MIPASYLYKDAYRQTWLDADMECANARAVAHYDGHHIWDTLTAMVARLAHRRPSFQPSRAAIVAYDCA